MQVWSFLLIFAAALPARAELAPSLNCVVPSSPKTRIVLAKDAQVHEASVLQDGVVLERYDLPLQPSMASANGSISATYSAPDFVLTLSAEELDETDPDGEGFAAFRLPGASAVAFEVMCTSVAHE